MLLQTIGFTAVAPGAAGAAGVIVAGDSAVVQAARPDSKIQIVALYGKWQTNGFAQVITPAGHDTTRGYRVRCGAAAPQNLLPWGMGIELRPQELIQALIAGSAVAGDVEGFAATIMYEDLPGVAGKFIDRGELLSRMRDMVTVEDLLLAPTSQQWSGARLITAGSDLLKANTDYAILGATSQILGISLGIRAPDFGNVRIGIPSAPANSEQAANWFPYLSDSFARPMIPVINSGNRGNIWIDALQDENVAQIAFSLILAELEGQTQA